MPYIGNITSDFSIDTGNITNRAVTATKLSPSSVGSNGQVLSVDGSGNLQWGNDANAPEGTAVLSTGESGTTKYLRVDGDGTCSWQLAVDATKTTLTGSTNNTICTVTGANAITGEANLTFNNSALSIINTSNLGDAFLYIKAGEAGASVIELQADEADDNNDLWRIQNAGDSKLGFRSKTSGSWIEKLGITANGHVGIGVTPSAWPTNADSIALQIGTGFAAYGRGSGDEDRGGIAVNYYNDGSSEYYIANGHANRIYMNDGNIDFQYAGNNTNNAGAALSWTSGIRMKADGKVGIGTTAPTKLLHLSGGTSPTLKISASDATPGIFLTDANRTSQDQHLGEFQANWNGNLAGRIVVVAGPDTTNKDDGHMDFYTSNGGSNGHRMRIKHDGKIGIGTTSPSSKLHVAGSDDQDNFKVDVSGSEFVIHTDTTDGEISLRAQDGSGNNYAKYMSFYTHPSGAAADERFRITPDGHVGINSTSPHDSSWGTAAQTRFLHIKGPNYGVLSLEGDSTTNTKWSMGAGDNRFYMAYNENDSVHVLDAVKNTRDVEVMAGNLVLRAANKGIDFTGGSSVGTAANILDDYEEGQFNPGIVGSNSAGTFASSSIEGHYTKIGNRVHLDIYIDQTSTDGTGQIRITGAPFACAGGSPGPQVAGSCMLSNVVFDADFSAITPHIWSNSSQIVLYGTKNNATWAALTLTSNTGTGPAYIVSITYPAA